MKSWQELYYLLGKGDASNIAELKKIDIFEFFTLLEVYEQDVKQRTKWVK